MTARSLEGTIVQAELLAGLISRVRKLKQQGITPGIGTVLVGIDPASAYYIKSLKHSLGESIGLVPIHAELPEDATTDDVLKVIDNFNDNSQVSAYIVQLPLPKQINTQQVLERINPAKDADGLHPINLGRLVLGEKAPLPCTPYGILHLLRYYNIPIDGANITVIGRGITVGRSLGLLLTRKSENATVTLTHTGTRNLAEHTRRADIVISAVGVPDIVTAAMIKPGATVIDVGISRVDGKIKGDIAADVWECAGAVSPNPKGVGPLTTGFLMSNVIDAAEAQLN